MKLPSGDDVGYIVSGLATVVLFVLFALAWQGCFVSQIR